LNLRFCERHLNEPDLAKANHQYTFSTVIASDSEAIEAVIASDSEA